MSRPAIPLLTRTGVWLTALVATGVVHAQTQSRALSAAQVVEAARGYLRTYEQEFTYLLADEQTQQEVAQPRTVQRSPTIVDVVLATVETRSTTGEMFAARLDVDRTWVSIHDVATVDGRAVGDREDLRTLLDRSNVQSVAARVFARNARFNIGSVQRNFNEPTLALLVLQDVHVDNFRFEIGKRENDLVVLTFRERDRPTLVRNTDGGPVFAEGQLTVEPATGVVRRTRIFLDAKPASAELTTEFLYDRALRMWVPSVFTERYVLRRASEQVTTCVSRYTNYRRFQSAGRLIVPDGR